jgi:hypothetical protein
LLEEFFFRCRCCFDQVWSELVLGLHDSLFQSGLWPSAGPCWIRG